MHERMIEKNLNSYKIIKIFKFFGLRGFVFFLCNNIVLNFFATYESLCLYISLFSISSFYEQRVFSLSTNYA